VEQNTEWLRKEVPKWKDKGIITEEQAHTILSQYEGELPEEAAEEAAKGRSRVITSISIIGSVLIGIGVLLIVASHWDEIPDFLRFILLAGTTFATYYLGWRLEFETKTKPRLGHALIFLASIMVGATIFLTAQIFNVNANAHWLVFLWFLAISPLCYPFNSKPILGLSLFTFTLWMFLYVSSMKGVYVSTLGLFMLYLLFGISLYGLGQIHTGIKPYSRFRFTYQNAGLFFILVSYFFFSLITPYENDLGEISTTDWTIRILFVLFGATALITVAHTGIHYKKFKQAKYEFFMLLLALAGWAGIWLVSFFADSLAVSVTQYGYTSTRLNPTSVTVIFVVYTLVLFALSIGSILIGYSRTVTSFMNLGMFFFVLGVLHLYFTTLYRLLPRSLAFIVGGLILLGTGWYLERKRRLLIEEMEPRNHG
jgi:uncharacterized membrane protein